MNINFEDINQQHQKQEVINSSDSEIEMLAFRTDAPNNGESESETQGSPAARPDSTKKYPG